MRTLLFVVIAATASPPRGGAPAGTVRSERAAVEILPRGEATRTEIQTPQGFIRIEGGQPPATGAAGSFGVYASGGGRSSLPPDTSSGAPYPAAGTADRALPGPADDRCRTERNRYVRRLLAMAGIDLEDPLALLDGLGTQAGQPGALLFSAYGLLPIVDPIRPLAWDSELRVLARELAACSRERAR